MGLYDQIEKRRKAANMADNLANYATEHAPQFRGMTKAEMLSEIRRSKSKEDLNKMRLVIVEMRDQSILRAWQAKYRSI